VSQSATLVLDLGVVPYLPAEHLQKRLRSVVAGGALRGIILLLEHEPVITLGKRGTVADIRDPEDAALRGVTIVGSERGGLATLHAPGQLISYPIMPLPRRDVRSYVFDLEEVLARVLSDAGLTATRVPGHPGLYVEGAKVASLGLRCEHGIASHGTSLNVDLDLSLFDLVTACGDPHMRQTSICAALGRSVSMDWIKRSYVAEFSAVFGSTFAPTRALSRDQVEAVLGLHPAWPGHTVV
jgi:lipoate-protein ligase B